MEFMDIKQIIEQAETEGEKLLPDLQNIVKTFDFSKQPMCSRWLLEDKYVRYLGGLCKVLKCNFEGSKPVCEIGTMWGNSTLGLCFGSEKVISHDVDISNFMYSTLLKPEFELKQVDPDWCKTEDYSKYSFIYVDIGNHDGLIEREVHKRITETYKGYVAWDDINWHGMKPFWDEIQQEKIAVDWHGGPESFGIVHYK